MGRIKNNNIVRLVLNFGSIIVGVSLLLAYLATITSPKSISFIALFGLGYPIIIIVFLALTVIQLFFNRWWALGMFTLILLGGTMHFRTFTLGNGDASKGAKEVKIMSYNVHLFDVYNPDQKKADKTRREIISFLKKENPDIVCFQEFYHQDQPSTFPTKDTILPLLNYKDYQERYAHYQRGRKNYGIAIFTRYPIVEKGEVNFNPEKATSNFAIYSDIVVLKDTIRVYNVHLQSIHLETSSGTMEKIEKIKDNYPMRASQSEILTKHIEKSPYPVVLCGDFNDTPMSYTYSQFGKTLIDAFRNCSVGIGKTYAGKIPAGRIDYIFHSETIGSNNFKVQKKALSDHYAISCNVFVKKK